MGDEPDVVGAHVLVDVDQDEDAGHEDAEEDVGPLGDGVWREKIGEQEKINEQNDARDE